MRVADLLSDLAACLKVTLEDNDAGDLCYMDVVPGDGVISNYAWPGDSNDCVHCGVAWVRLISSYPAVTPGEQYAGKPKGAGLGLDIEVGVARCIAVAAEDGVNPPPAAEMVTATGRGADDMELIRKAIYCCAALETPDWSLGAFIPAGPQGGMVGGVWSVSVVL